MSGWLAAVGLALAVAVSGRRRPGARLALAAEPPGSGLTDRSGWVTWLWALAFAAGGLLSAARLSVPVVVAAVVGPAIGVGVRRRMAAARDRERCASATIEVTFALAGEMRAGRSSSEALASVATVAGPLRPAFEAAHQAVVVGADAAAELALAATTPGAERLRYVAAAWAVADATGGRVAVVLERLSEAMDDDDELRRELEAAMAGPRATIVMLGSLPLLGLLLGQAVGAHPLTLLLHRPLGWALLAAAAGLDGVGVIVTRAIARAALRP